MSSQIDYLERLEHELRAAATRQAERPLRRRWALLAAPRVLVAAAVVVLMSASLALAFGGRVLTALGGGPAPKPVKSEFRNLVKPPFPLDGAPPLPKGYLPGKIVRGSERRVLTVRTSRGTVAALYVARTTSGQLCVVIRGWPFAGGGCWGATPPGNPFAALTQGFMSQRAGTWTRNGPVRTLVGRTASPRARVLRVIYRDGSHHDIALVDGWFMFELAGARAQAGAAPVQLDVLSASGARLGTLADPFYLHAPKPHFTQPLPSSIRLLAAAELPNGGGTVEIWSGRDAEGRNCFRHLRNGHSQVFPVWECTGAVGHYGYPLHPAHGLETAHVAVRWQIGLANDSRKPVGYGYAYATGWVAPHVARLTLRFQDGSAADIPLHDLYFLYVVPPANWPAGHRPSILEARDAQGGVVYREFLYPRQHCIYPGRDPFCRNIAMGTG